MPTVEVESGSYCEPIKPKYPRPIIVLWLPVIGFVVIQVPETLAHD